MNQNRRTAAFDWSHYSHAYYTLQTRIKKVEKYAIINKPFYTFSSSKYPSWHLSWTGTNVRWHIWGQSSTQNYDCFSFFFVSRQMKQINVNDEAAEYFCWFQSVFTQTKNLAQLLCTEANCGHTMPLKAVWDMAANALMHTCQFMQRQGVAWPLNENVDTLAVCSYLTVQ